MNYADIRNESWTALWSNGWFGRIFGAMVAVTGLYLVVAVAMQIAFVSYGVTGLDKYLNEWMLAMRAGLGRPALEGHAALRMVGAWLFTNFINFIFAGILSYAWACVCLSAAHDDRTHATLAAFGGAKHPFGMFWLTLLVQIRIFLWSLLFVVPGVIAWFRYRMAWFVKTEHPDWSAGKCLAESGRLMKGNKWRSFVLDCSYWKAALLFLLPTLLLSALGAAGALLGASDGGTQLPSAGRGILTLAALACTLAGVAGGLVFTTHLGVGHAVFYREICRGKV